MIQFNAHQLLQLAQAEQDTFVDKVQAHFLQTYIPDAKEPWGDYTPSDLRARIERGIARAKQYGFNSEEEWFDFLVCQMALGEGFEGDPRYPWAAAILNDTQGSERSQRLYKAMIMQRHIDIREEVR